MPRLHVTLHAAFGVALALVPLAMLSSYPAFADAASSMGGVGTSSTDGQVIYTQVCRGCHMPDARGATGAGTIPALAGDLKLQNAGFPIYMVLNGRGGMPWLGSMLSDAQVAAVVTYVRTHFGNHYADIVAPADVTSLRGAEPAEK